LDGLYLVCCEDEIKATVIPGTHLLGGDHSRRGKNGEDGRETHFAQGRKRTDGGQRQQKCLRIGRLLKHFTATVMVASCSGLHTNAALLSDVSAEHLSAGAYVTEITAVSKLFQWERVNRAHSRNVVRTAEMSRTGDGGFK
jgi:hypothetical protein